MTWQATDVRLNLDEDPFEELEELIDHLGDDEELPLWQITHYGVQPGATTDGRPGVVLRLENPITKEVIWAGQPLQRHVTIARAMAGAHEEEISRGGF